MKNNKNKIAVLLTVLAASSCATGPDHYTPAPYREDVSFYKPFTIERFPANARDCLSTLRNFFGAERNLPSDLIHNPVTVKKITEAMAKNPLRYPKGFEDKEGFQIQYGFESEYLHDEVGPLLKNYMPAPPFYNGTKEEWLSLKPKERLEQMDSLIKTSQYEDDPEKQIFAYRAKGKLIKITDDKELNDALPDSYVYDAGHFEIVLDPSNTAEEIITKIKVINKHLGVGSMQLTVSNPIDKAMLKDNKEARAELKAELLGYYNFMNDFDTLSKLDVGYERYLKDPKTQVVKSFNHPWLGPMNKLKHDKLEALIDGIVENKQYSVEQLQQMSYLVVSHKFIGGLSFRPDVAYKKSRLASEVRDCHQNVKCIEDRIIRETYFLMKGKESFKSFSELKQFDTVTNFKDLKPEDLQYMLKDLFPTYGEFSQKELQLYRNFTYPYRDWSKHIEVLGKPGLKDQIANAQTLYTETLKKIMFEYNAKMISNDKAVKANAKEEAKTKVMGALAEFSKKSGLTDAMKEKYNELLNPEEIKNFNVLKFTFYINVLKLTGESIALARRFEIKLTA
jgi:hypothetical protein